MKTLLLVLSLISYFSSKAQVATADRQTTKQVWAVKPLPLENNEIVYADNISLSGYSHDELFKNVLDWYNNNFKTADTKLSVENKEQGAISGSGVIHYGQNALENGPQNIFFTFSVQLGGAGYSYRFYDIYSMVNGEKISYRDMYREENHPTTSIKPHWTHKYRYEALSDMDSFMILAINQFKKYIKRK